MTDDDRPRLGEDFPAVRVDVSIGEWWRIHSDGYGPW